jgi:hypothetical protein
MRKLSIITGILALALVFAACENPASGRDPVDDPESIVIPAGTLGTIRPIYVLQGASGTLRNAIGKDNLEAPLPAGVNLVIPYIPSDAATIENYNSLSRYEESKTIKVTLSTNPGYTFEEGASYTFGGDTQAAKADLIEFNVPYTVVDGLRGNDLETATLGSAAVILDGTSGSVTLPNGQLSGLTFAAVPTVQSANATITLLVSANATEPGIDINNATLTGLAFSNTNKYLHVKIVSTAGTKIYKITVTEAPPSPADIGSNSTLGNVPIKITGSQSGESPQTAITAQVRLTGDPSNVAFAAGTGASGVRSTVITQSAAPTPVDADFSGGTTGLDFTRNGTILWIRAQVAASGSTRYYKVTVILDPVELVNAYLYIDPIVTTLTKYYVSSSSQKSGDSIANAIEGTVVVDSLGSFDFGGQPINGTDSAYLLSDAPPSVPGDMSTTFNTAVTLTDGGARTIWIKVASWERDAVTPANPASFKFYKIAVVVQ